MTKHYLQLNTSLAGADSVSSRLASDTIDRLVAADRAVGTAVVVTVRDLASDPLPHLTAGLRLEQLAA